ncbi:MAG: hypothetical protein KAU50_05680 [Candidatus Marinimicrobia bacterium]|nr:hypothetical protein [Candidatus Neomarinimicrobiota bacterium]
MRPRAEYLYPLLILLLACGQEYGRRDANPNFDFTALDLFWEITGQLQKNVDPDEALWDSLFNTAAYQSLAEVGFSTAEFRGNVTLVFRTDQAELLNQLLKTGSDGQLRHLVQVRNRQAELRKHQSWVSSAPVMLEARRAVRLYLPDQIMANYPPLPVAFAIFERSLLEGEPMVIDLLYSSEQEQELSYIIGHTAHHYYRNKVLLFDPDAIDPADEDIVWVVNQIHSEGLADRVDLRVIYFGEGSQSKSPAAQRYRQNIEAAPAIIVEMDRLLIRIAERADNYQQSGQELRALLPMDGHAIGYYMASVIIKAFASGELNTRIGNPFAFFRLYNIAAAMHDIDAPAFSGKAMAVLVRLEHKYIK